MYNYTYQKTDGAIKNGQLRNTGNMGHKTNKTKKKNTHKKKHKKHNTTKINNMIWTPQKQTGGEPMCWRCVTLQQSDTTPVTHNMLIYFQCCN